MKRCNGKRATAGAHARYQLEAHKSWRMSSQWLKISAKVFCRKMKLNLQVFKHAQKRKHWKVQQAKSVGWTLSNQIFNRYKICVALLLLRLSVLFSAVSQDHSFGRTRHTVSHQLTLAECYSWPDCCRWTFTAHINPSQRHTAVTPSSAFPLPTQIPDWFQPKNAFFTSNWI